MTAAIGAAATAVRNVRPVARNTRPNNEWKPIDCLLDLNTKSGKRDCGCSRRILLVSISARRSLRPDPGHEDVMIVLSRNGKDIDILRSAQKANELGAKGAVSAGIAAICQVTVFCVQAFAANPCPILT